MAGMERPSRRRALWMLTGSIATFSLGCRAHQFGHIVKEDQADLVGSHSAGADTFNPLVDEAVAKLLGRQEGHVHHTAYAPGTAPVKRICFLGVENYSAEEIGDFKEQLYEQIDTRLRESQAFDALSRRYVEAGLRETRLRPEMLFNPEHMRNFSVVLEQQGQPFDYLLFAKLTSGTTQRNHNTQRDYLLTLELVDIRSGRSDKESAKIRKGYHKSLAGRWFSYNPFTRQ